MTTLADVRLRCPVCEKEFTSQRVVSTNSFGGKRTDFQVRAAGIQPTGYLAHLCPRCGYAGKEPAFEEGVTADPVIVEHVWNELAPRLSSGPLNGSDRFEHAAKIASWMGASSFELGELYLHAAWCCVDENDVEAERYFRRLAAWSLADALAEYDAVAPNDRAILTYLVGELWRRIGDTARAAEWFDRVQDEVVDADEQQWVAEFAQRQKDDPREWFSGEVHRATSKHR